MTGTKELSVKKILCIENIQNIKLVCIGEKSELFEKRILSYIPLNNKNNICFANVFINLFGYIRGLCENLTLMKIVVTTNDYKQIEFDVSDMMYYSTVVDENLINLFDCTLNYIIENDNINTLIYNHNQDGYITSKLKPKKTKQKRKQK